MHTLRNSLKFVMALSLISFLLSVPSFGGFMEPGKYNGVVIFDRWGACYLYNGIYLMPISEKVKDSLRDYKGKAVLIDAQEVFQPINPGDGLIKKLVVLGPAAEPDVTQLGKPPKLEGLELRVASNFSVRNPDQLIIQLHNEGAVPLEIKMDALAPTLLAKKRGPKCFNEPSDGPSNAAFTRWDIAHLFSRQGLGRWCGTPRTIKLVLAPGTAHSRILELDPGQSIEIRLLFELSPGEYDFLAGYGGAGYEARNLASNQIDFDVDQAGKAHLITP